MGNLDFNADEHDDPISFDVMPDGTILDVEIESTEQKPNKKGDGAYLEIVFLATDGEHKGRKLWERLNLWTERDTTSDTKEAKAARNMLAMAHRSLAAICRGIGKLQVDNHEELVGGCCRLTLGVEPAKGDFPARNKIKKVERIGAAKASTPDKPAAKNGGKPAWSR